MRDIIEKAYLDDIFKMVLNVTKDTPEELAIKHLYQLSRDLNLFEIRNAIAHPNRAFLDVYWYRVAVIAADPAFDSLRLKDVKAILYSAEKGVIEDPPEGWDKKYNWDIPNNLPVKFESDITGLIGRNKELLELKGKILSPRISTAAIIAPGGYGKTALLLDLLKIIVTDSKSTNWVDAVSYVTLKTEAWENDAFVKLDAVSEIKAVEQLIAEQLGLIFDEYIDDIEQAIKKFSDKRVILCIDNLETILRDDDSLFHDFVDRLPRDWKVIVTSRVVITNAYIYPLSELKEEPAVRLARLYNRNKGGDELPQEKYIKIAKYCHFNPLAIKMTLDLYIGGKEIPDSLNQAKSNVAYFSFSNLIESLSEYALKVLELIFIESETSRKLICEILYLSTDDAASAINELSRTSLINRGEKYDKESYEINGSIKDLLIINPKCLELRAEIQQRLNKQKVVSNEIDIKQRASKLPSWHFQYIPSDADHGLKIIMKEFAKIRFSENLNKQLVSSVYAKFKQSEEHYKNDYLFARTYAKLLSSMQLVSEAKKYYLKALSLKDDMVTKYVAARHFFEQDDFDNSSELYVGLVKNIEAEEFNSENTSFYNSIYQGFFLSHLYKGEHQAVIDHTIKWKESTNFRALWGTFRASAFKRKTESISNSNVDEILSCLNSATKIFDDIFRTDGYSQSSCAQGFKVIEEICYFLNRGISYGSDPSTCLEFLVFCDKHLLDIVETSKNRTSDDVKLIANSLAEIPLDGNPFKDRKFWKSYGYFSSPKGLDLSDISESDKLTTVKRLATNPKGARTNFLFTEDEYNQEYFVHFNTVGNCNWNDWLKLHVGINIAVMNSEVVQGKTAITVIECSLVNS